MRKSIILTTLVLAGCSAQVSYGGRDVGVRVPSYQAQRLVGNTGPLPKGGGVHKIGKPYQIAGKWYTPHHDPSYDRVGIASWYGPEAHGRRTANGEIFDMNALTAAHPTLPIPSYAYVTNLSNNRTILVRINDRGPFVKNRVIDLSRRVAHELGYFSQGTTRVRVRYAGRAPLNGDERRERAYLRSRSWHGASPRYALGR